MAHKNILLKISKSPKACSVGSSQSTEYFIFVLHPEHFSGCVEGWRLRWLVTPSLQYHRVSAIFFFFLSLHLWHMEVPGLGVKSELQLRPTFRSLHSDRDPNSLLLLLFSTYDPHLLVQSGCFSSCHYICIPASRTYRRGSGICRFLIGHNQKL